MGLAEYRHINRQKELIGDINTEIETLKTERGIDDEIYKRYLKGAKASAEIIKSRN
jgi:hypothetical protein